MIDCSLIRKYIKLKDNKRIGQIMSSYHLMKESRIRQDYNEARQFMAVLGAVRILVEKGVKCYYFERVGEIKDFEYDDRAKYRMKNGLSFVKMMNDPLKYTEDLKQLLGDTFSEDNIQNLASITQVVKKGNHFRHEDIVSDLVNIIDGERVVVDKAFEDNQRNIYMYGRCGVFGYAVSDEETMPSALQKELNERYFSAGVFNRGIWGGTDETVFHNFIMDCDEFSAGDIVIFYMKKPDEGLKKVLLSLGMRYVELTEKWHSFKASKWCFYDKPGHMNKDGYKNVAKLIADVILNDSVESTFSVEGNPHDYSNYYCEYLKSEKNNEYNEGIQNYIEKVQKCFKCEAGKTCGAIVMNCNPFTIGHRYLIDYASSKVDYLYIFVVEEDKSFFKFEDRFEMVKLGTKDIANVIVIPSGKFIISTLTFPEYFMKDYVQNKDFDVSSDVETFGKYIAPKLSITKRFVGEEPFDTVTRKYNETMAQILPRYGLELCEIPRYSSDETGVVSATKVRELMKRGEIEELSKYVPETTMHILKRNYMGIR